MKKYLVCFGDSSLKLSKWILNIEAKTMNVYDEILFYDESSLDEDFMRNYKSIMCNNRGFGYWMWKPQIILQLLNKINQGDIINYIDIGCKLNFLARKRLIEYFSIVNSSRGILAFQYGNSKDFIGMNSLNFLEKQFTKGDLFSFFGLSNDSLEANTFQYQAGVIFIKKCDFSINLIKEWSRISKIKNLIDDSPSETKNFKNFIDHRHDQSIFSLLCKKNNVKTLSAYETEPLSFKEAFKNRTLYKYPIITIRRKQKTILPFIKKNVFELIKQLISLFLKKKKIHF
jgi:hypothetical protein